MKNRNLARRSSIQLFNCCSNSYRVYTHRWRYALKRIIFQFGHWALGTENGLVGTQDGWDPILDDGLNGWRKNGEEEGDWDTCTGVRVNVRGWCATRYYADKIFMVIGARDRARLYFSRWIEMVPSPGRTQILCPVDDNEDGKGGREVGKRKKESMEGYRSWKACGSKVISITRIYHLSEEKWDLSNTVFFNEYFYPMT